MTSGGGGSRSSVTCPSHPIEKANEALCDALEALQRAIQNNGIDPLTKQTDDEAARVYYLSLAEVLRAFNAPANWRRDGSPKAPLPRFAAFEAGRITDDLLSGRVPPSIKRLFFGSKRPGIKAQQRRAIEAAVRYIEASRRQPIVGINPVQIVAESFGVAEGSVNRWVRDHPADERELSPQRVSRPKYLAMLKQQMQESAKLYRHSRHVKARR